MGRMVDGLSAELDGGGVGARHWIQEPDIPRVAHGVPERVNRLKALGNSVVPQIPELIARRLKESFDEAQAS